MRAALVAGLVGLATGCDRGGADLEPARVVILGFDGMDHEVTARLMAAGRLPHFQRLAAAGFFQPLATSVPPQSPVAWSNFITGQDAGGHGIFDFIHRDPATMQPYLSTSRTEPGRSLSLGPWRLPLSGGDVVLLRHGAAFWDDLTRRGIETTIVRIPANFPPSGTATRELSGMGTPDLLGTYGTFTLFTDDPSAAPEVAVSGGRVVGGRTERGVHRGALRGPDHPFRSMPRPLETGFELHLDPQRPLAKLVLGDAERIVQEGEWTDWVPVEFGLGLGRRLHGMCRFYLKQVRPVLQLYASPVNLDPMQPAMPISAPASWAGELARATGRFYTQGMPEDTKALASGIFEPQEFLRQAQIAADENLAQYQHVFAGFERGLLFHYFGSVDQVSHMMWRPMDPGHPAYDPALDPPFAEVVHGFYEQMDAIVGWTMQRLRPTDLLLVMSDHGFTSWRRSFHLNAWLRQQGYLAVRDPNQPDAAGMLTNVDWQLTRAYGLGLNGLYINLRGRERWGSVAPEERAALLAEIAALLRAVVDPATGAPAVTRVSLRDEAYADGGQRAIGPDLVVGYAAGTRCSDESAIGSVVAGAVFSDNTGEWSGDHCMDDTAVPGILLGNRSLRRPVHGLQDMAAAIRAEFGLEAGVPAAHAARP
jgi:predicted AlkP superfamily phosphohydrolase/phosphomutase